MTEYKLDNKFNDSFKQAALGISIGENNQLAEFSRLLRTGAQMAEVDLASLYGFTGQGTSAARLGKTEREALGNLARASDVDLSIHAPWSINFSGIVPDQNSGRLGQRDPEYRKLINNEMKAAIDFANDVSKSMGREHMPIIFHAASDHFGTPDPKSRISAYDNEADKVISIGQTKLDHITPEKFREIYGEASYNQVKDGMKRTEDGKSVILSPEATFAFQKDQVRMDLNQQRVSLEVNRRNLDIQKLDLANEIATASMRGESQRIAELSRRKEAYDQMSKDLDAKGYLLDNEIQNLDTRFSRFEEKAPMLAAEGIKDAALMSANTLTKPMILIENTMTPDMSLSKPSDVAEAVSRARDLFVEEEKKRGMDEDEARELSEKLIGVNLDVGHLNIFKSYGLKNQDIQNMLLQGNKVKDANGNEITMPNIAEFVKRYHLNDNMGDLDAHLPLGEGTVPVKEIFQTLRNAGVEAPSIMEVFGGAGGIEAGMSQSLQYLGEPLAGNIPFNALPVYAANPYSSIVGDYSSYSGLGLKQDLFSYNSFSGLSPILGGGYMENNRGGGGFSGAPMS